MAETHVKPAKGKLGIMVVGNGAVATTFMTGVLMARKGLAKPVGAMTQYDKIRIGKGNDKKYLHYKDIVPLADLNDIVFGTWDVYPQNSYQAAVYAEVLKREDIDPVKDELEKIVPLKAAFDKNYAKRLDGDNIKRGEREEIPTRWEMVELLREDIRQFKAKNSCDRIVVLWAASTEIYVPVDMNVHDTLEHLEKAMKADDREHVAPSMCYAYAALTEGCPFIMGAPNTTVDIPAMWELAEKTKMPIAGKDFKTGQTLVKSGFAPIIGTRCLGLSGWFSSRRARELPHQGSVEALNAGDHTQEGRPARPLYRLLPQGTHKLLSAAQRQQGVVGQHRHLRMDGVPHAGKNKLPLSRLDTGSTGMSRPLSAYGLSGTRRALRHSALPELLPEVAYARLHPR